VWRGEQIIQTFSENNNLYILDEKQCCGLGESVPQENSAVKLSEFFSGSENIKTGEVK